LNSSFHTGIAANCELIFLPSPLFEHLRLSSVKLGNFNNMQAFIFTTRVIAAGEELRWKYSIDQAHRYAAQPPSPTTIVTTPNPNKRLAAQAAVAKRVCAVEPAVRVLHNCPHHTTCNPGKCSECKCSVCGANQVQKGISRPRTTPAHFE
jgi:hypothetical protein